MMLVAVERLHASWPQAEISVVTNRPDRLARLCPAARPVAEQERSAWLSGRSLIGGLPRVSFWLKHPHLCNAAATLKAGVLGRTKPGTFHRELTSADLVIVTGMGMINDAFSESALDLLDELHAALLSGREVVAFGQGIGPITDPELLARAKEVLPKLKLIALRESYGSLKLLDSIGVSRDCILISGDDALEAAHNKRRDVIGTVLGINVRVARYSSTSERSLGYLRSALFSVSEDLGISLVPLPISFSEESSDSRAIINLLDGHSSPRISDSESLDELLDTIALCRVVVTGSYHAGVFALAQGIPVVALVQSPYYDQKFSGLKDQFGGIGCDLIDFRRTVSSDQIAETIVKAWASAEQVRDRLLSAAASQISKSRAAYAMLTESGRSAT
jgi:colanic acid/amylovoran biosynthesis protein